MTRRELLAASVAAPFLASAQKKRLNVLLIAVDDLNTRLGCYGDRVVKSPNIDRLAARGMRFDRAYCQFPLCNPSRTSLLSGRRPDSTQVFGNRTEPRSIAELKSAVFLPEHFRQNDYFTARVGKIAHGLFEHNVTWDVSESARGGGGARRTAAAKRAAGGGVGLSWTATANADADEPDGRTARRIVQLMEEQRDKLFFLGAGFHKPHLPFVAPKKYFDMYPPESIELPNTPADDRADIPPIALTSNPADDKLTDANRKQAIAAYHAATTFTDAQVGVLLDAMDRLKLWDNTIVLLFGDHGWHLNEHGGLWRKMSVFEESARAPFLLYAPGYKAGQVSKRLVEFVDFYPTLTSLCGLPKPDGLEGHNVVPLLERPERSWKKAAYTQVQRRKDIMGRSVRTERYRYTEWNGPETAELYDHGTDPHEYRNLVKDTRLANVVKDHRALLADWRLAAPKV